MGKHKTPNDMVTGTTHTTATDGDLVIVEYLNSNEVQIRFDNYNDVITASAGNIRKGLVKNPKAPRVFGVGFTGIGKYSTKDKKASQLWRCMLQRCYSEEFHIQEPSYAKCEVCDEWLDFQNFADWFYNNSNYREGLQLDKDVLVQGNKVYSPSTCIFVTREVNNLTTDSKATRGELKLGVSMDAYSKKFKAQCSSKKYGKKHLGLFDTEDEAHKAYCIYKYNLLREIALEQEDENVKAALLARKLDNY